MTQAAIKIPVGFISQVPHMLTLITSNRYECLSRRLLDDLAERGPAADPFRAEPVLVPGAALRRRLELDWARHHGVCANVAFGFLAQWVWQVLRRVVPVAAASPFAPELLAWRLYRLLGEPELVGAHPRLARYLERAGQDPLMRYELAARLGRLFDQYITYRQGWVKAWAEGHSVTVDAFTEEQRADQAWQGALWRRLLADMGAGAEHPAEAFFRELEAGGAGALPPRVSIFAPSDMPHLYLAILARLSGWMEVNLYVMNPCRDFWEHLVDPVRLARLKAEGRLDYHEIGHRLLAGWGGQTQALIALLNEVQPEFRQDDELFQPAPGSHLLARIQNDILDRTESSPAELPGRDWARDDSIAVHVCHSLTRELEVLHDRLLDRFSRDPTLRPADVLVLMPGLEDAAPLIEAVFGTVPRSRQVPFTVTGLPRALANPVAEGFRALLDLLPSRFKASEVFALLRRPLVSACLELSDDDLAAVHAWMREAGMHWGLDAEQRQSLDLPALASHTLDEGLDRLFLGYAAGRLDQPVLDWLPAGDVEGSIARALGALDHFIRQLRQAATQARSPATGAVWRERLLDWLDRFFAETPEQRAEREEVRQAIVAVCDTLRDTGVDEPLPLAVIDAALREALEAAAPGAVPGGAVTFAGLGTLRYLPYRVIAVLGLNDGVFPASRKAEEFDLIAAAPQLGDRQRRLDERNLFLDTLLAAREHLHISYTGNSIRDNSALTPSILLAELLEAMERLTGLNRQCWIVRHPLQAFSRRYFDPAAGDGPLFSYAGELAEALNRTQRSEADKASLSAQTVTALDKKADGDEERDNPLTSGAIFCPVDLPARDDDSREISLNDLLRFFRQPCRYWLERRLRLTLPGADEELADDEAFVPGRDEHNRLADELLPLAAQSAPEDLLTLARGTRAFPEGPFGDALLEDVVADIRLFAERLALAEAPELLPPVSESLAFAVGDEIWRLHGALNDLRPGGLVRHRYADLGPVFRLLGWIEHLFLNAIAPEGVGPETLWLTRDGGYRLPALGAAEARAELSELVGLYRRGWQRPLRFFPRAAWAYADKLGEGRDAALNAADQAWSPKEWGYYESSEPAYQLALRGVAQPLDAEFEAAAVTVFQRFRELAQELDIQDGADDD
jgi:exodeoxyribonuclease V gamma subunit